MICNLNGKRLHLRDWLEQDLDLYWNWIQPGHLHHDYNGPYYTRSLESIQLGFDQLKKRVLDKNFCDPRESLVIADKASNQIIGLVSSYWESIETQWLCAGLTLYDESTWGKGLGYEALGLWTDYLFRARPSIVRLDLRTWSGNLGMMRLAEKLGYQFEARFRKARIVKGAYYDSVGYGILREEWQARFPTGFSC